MGLPANIGWGFTEPEADEAFIWSPSKSAGTGIDEGFASLPLGVSELVDERDDQADQIVFTDTDDGLQMEGVEIGIASASDQDLESTGAQALEPDADYLQPDADYLQPDADYIV